MKQAPAQADSAQAIAPCSLDELPAMVLLLDAKGAARHVNAAFVAYCGLGAGSAWLGLLDEASRAGLRAALAAGGDFELRLRLGGVGSMPRWVDLATRAVRPGSAAGADGSPSDEACHVCVLHDVTSRRQAELAALSKAEQFRLLADNMPVLIAYYDVEGLRCGFANRQYAGEFGLDERSILGRTVGEVVGAEALRQIEPYIGRMLGERRAVAYEREPESPDGAGRWIEVNLVPHPGPDGAPVGTFVLITDITRFRHAEQAVRESEERLAKFMQASTEGIVFLHEGIVTDANPAACALIGHPLDEVRGRSPFDFVGADQIALVAGMMKSGAEVTFESVVIHRDGRRIPVECLMRTLMHHGVPTRLAIIRDLSDRRAAQARIHHLAHHDALTGLPNRSVFMERLEHLVASSSPSSPGGGLSSDDGAFALLFIDLDHFKRVNDSLGHLVGDRVLQAVAARLTAGLRASDGVGRFGGDEFLVLLHGASRREDIEAATRKLTAAIEVAVEAEGGPIAVSPSVGIARFPHDGTTPAELIRHAEAAMHEAKRRGRASWRFYDVSLADAAYASVVMEGELAQAIARNEFVLHFQPQVCARSGAIVGAEALIRWRHPERGLLAPDQFIPLAEQHRLMLPIGRWVLRMAVRRARQWQHGALAGAIVGVNLTSLQFEASGFVEHVAAVLREEGLAGPLLELELTERMVTTDLTSTGATLARLKALGVRISLDDFGTGYTSLAQLKALPIDKMKIDRCFVTDLPHDRKSAAITRAILQLAQGLGIQAIAEGVENEGQRGFLVEHGCDELQGHAISEPLAYEALQAWAEARAEPIRPA